MPNCVITLATNLNIEYVVDPPPPQKKKKISSDIELRLVEMNATWVICISESQTALEEILLSQPLVCKSRFRVS